MLSVSSAIWPWGQRSASAFSKNGPVVKASPSSHLCCPFIHSCQNTHGNKALHNSAGFQQTCATLGHAWTVCTCVCMCVFRIKIRFHSWTPGSLCFCMCVDMCVCLHEGKVEGDDRGNELQGNTHTHYINTQTSGLLEKKEGALIECMCVFVCDSTLY